MAAAVPLLIAGWYLAGRVAKNLAKALTRNPEQNLELILALKGGWGQFLLEGGRIDQAVEVLPGEGLGALLHANGSQVKEEGVLDAYRKEPQKFKRYAEVCDTWFRALRVNSAAQRLPAGSPLPLTSASMTTVAPQYRLDAWGHTFCIFRGAEQVAIVSAGPGSNGFKSCNQVRLTRTEIDRLAVVPITRQQSGALIMVFKRQADANLGNWRIRIDSR
jgi:hypothetical protein